MDDTITRGKQMISMDKKYRTRDGWDVELISVNGRDKTYPVLGYTGDGTRIQSWTKDGLFHDCRSTTPLDLIEVSPARTAEYGRGQRDMRERCATVAVEQCGGGFHDRKRLRSAIAALPITPAIEKEATTSEDYDRDHPWHEDSDMGAR